MPKVDANLITTREASDLLNEGLRKTHRRIGRDLTPAHKLPGLRGAYLFNREEVEALKNRLERAATAA